MLEVLFDVVVATLDFSEHTARDELVERFPKTASGSNDNRDKPTDLAFETATPAHAEPGTRWSLSP